MPVVDGYMERKTAEVMEETWGHLAPDPGRAYAGHIIFTHSEYGAYVLIRVRFDDLNDSPWLFDDLNDFVAERAVEAGVVYRFDGTYRKFKTGKCQFVGKTRAIDLR